MLISAGPGYAQQRAVLYENSPSAQIQALAKILQDPRSAKVPSSQLPKPARYFVRITERRFVLTPDNKLLPTAVLAGPARPFAFLTTPEGFFGKSLLEIYGDIGYEAEDMIRVQRNADMVVMLFRYPDNVSLSPVSNGNLGVDWRHGIYSTTWDNVLSLFTRLVQDERNPVCKQDQMPMANICLPPNDRSFVRRFQSTARRQLRQKTKSYAVLHVTGGPLWRYRKLLEDKFSLFEHFRGDGRTENELLDTRDAEPKGQLYEVVGPNMKLSDLPEVVIIHLGKLVIDDCYSATSGELAKCPQP
ncbi:MAG TPA: hypothetical protein VGK82_07285 [Pyrinomonadaceae bacterium]